MESMEFLETMMQPGAGDEMVFRVERAEPEDGRTFSEEALGGMAENMKAFTMARTFARWAATGRAPTSMTAHLTIRWDDESDLEAGPPWWQVNDEGSTVPDGTDRLKGLLGLT
jgi:hypothetical protein